MTKKYNFTGWRTVVIKQHFEIEANSQEEANAKLWDMQNNFELDGQWFDYQTNKIKGDDEQPDFYDDDDEFVEETA